jgi:Integrase core domain
MRTDNGTEFTSRVFIAWAQGYCVRNLLIERGRPMQNDCIESFNGKFRDKRLIDRWFKALQHARTAASDARHRPSSLNCIAGDAVQQPANLATRTSASRAAELKGQVRRRRVKHATRAL